MAALHIRNAYGRLLTSASSSIMFCSGETVVVTFCAGGGVDKVECVATDRLAYAWYMKKSVGSMEGTNTTLDTYHAQSGRPLCMWRSRLVGYQYVIADLYTLDFLSYRGSRGVRGCCVRR